MKNATDQKIKFIWGIICSSSSVDIDTNNLSLQNIIEQLEIGQKVTASQGAPEEFPKEGAVVPLHMEIVSFWKRSAPYDESSTRAKIQIFDPQNTMISGWDFELKFQKNIERLRSRIKLEGFKITTPGEYRFVIEIQQEKGTAFTRVGEISLPVKFAWKSA